MNGSLFSITRYMNRVCFKVSGGTSVPNYLRVPPPHKQNNVESDLMSNNMKTSGDMRN